MSRSALAAREGVLTYQVLRRLGITARCIDTWSTNGVLLTAGAPGSGNHRTFGEVEATVVASLAPLLRMGCVVGYEPLRRIADAIRSNPAAAIVVLDENGASASDDPGIGISIRVVRPDLERVFAEIEAEQVPRDVRVSHGTLTGYTSHGCRCAHCRAALATYRRAQRAAKKADS